MSSMHYPHRNNSSIRSHVNWQIRSLQKASENIFYSTFSKETTLIWALEILKEVNISCHHLTVLKNRLAFSTWLLSSWINSPPLPTDPLFSPCLAEGSKIHSKTCVKSPLTRQATLTLQCLQILIPSAEWGPRLPYEVVVRRNEIRPATTCAQCQQT